MKSIDPQMLWQELRLEVTQHAELEPVLASYLHGSVLNHTSLASALAFHLANKLDGATLPAILIREVCQQAIADDPNIVAQACADICAYRERDAACDQYSMPFLYFKGFHAVQAYRIAHWLWRHQRQSLALFFQSRVAEVFDVDIHPAAVLGQGIMIDHATGVVIGETAVVEDDVSMLHSVTLGGSGHQLGDRHPKIRAGVLISTGAKILGNLEVGEGAKIGAGSLVLEPVAAHTTVVGVPAKVVGRPAVEQPALVMDHQLTNEEASIIGTD